MGEQRNELEHRMSRRSVHNNYSTRGIYHIVGKCYFVKKKCRKTCLRFLTK